MYANMYGSIDASGGQFKKQSMNRGSRGSELIMAGTQKIDHKDEINIRGSPKKNRSRSPLRTNPPEVFSRSPRSHRHEEEMSAAASIKSGAKRGSLEELRPQQATQQREASQDQT